MEEKIKELEDRLNREMKKVERELENIGKRIETEVNKIVGSGNGNKSGTKGSNRGAGLFWGLVFLAAGLIWLGNNLGWFYADVPWVPVALIAGGLTLIIRNIANENQSDHT